MSFLFPRGAIRRAFTFVAVVAGTVMAASPQPRLAVAQMSSVQSKGRDLPSKKGERFVLEDFNNKVTRMDLGFNNFSGPVGLVESKRGVADLAIVERAVQDWCCRLAFDFGSPRLDGQYAGLYLSLFGPQEALMSFDGSGRQPSQPEKVPGFYLDTKDLFRGFRPWQGRSVERLRLSVKPQAESAITLRLELKDENGQVAYARHVLSGKEWQTVAVPLPLADERLLGRPASTVNWSRLKQLVLIVESQHIAEGVTNPTRGALLIDDIQLEDVDGVYPDLDRARGRPEYASAFLEHCERMCFLYFLDFACRDPRSGGLIQDRSMFGDLLSVGGAGFQLSAYVIGANNGYISREDSAARTLAILKLLHDAPQGPDRVGCIGHRGWFYHFLGIDGRRKQNFDFEATRETNEALNTVELSSIDTALCVCGVLSARAYFDAPSNSQEIEIRRLADQIYDRVDWPFMLDKATQQFLLGWKPREARDDVNPAFGRFKLPDDGKQGMFASKLVDHQERPATIDYYTDEGLLLALLACSAPNERFRLPPSVFFSMKREGGDFVKTYPGSLFTYQFGSCWLDTRALGSDHDPAGKVRRVNYFQNTRHAIRCGMEHAGMRANGRATAERHHWGLSACEGPFDRYFAEAAPCAALASNGDCEVARAERPLDSGTRTVYGIGCSVQHFPAESVAALWECQRIGLLNPRVGFADAYHLDIAEAARCLPEGEAQPLRRSGPWRSFCGFSIDVGPMLIALDNHQHGTIPKLLASDPRIRNTLKQLFPDSP